MKMLLRSVLLLLAASLIPVQAAELFMARSEQAFPETMLALQELIKAHGYTVSRVQRVDVGLSNMGYKTDKYRVVFFGKADEVRRLTHTHPELIPYLPLKVAIFAQGDSTLLVSGDPQRWGGFFHDPALAPVFARWSADLRAIFAAVRASH